MGGYGASPITGNCHAQFKAQGFESHTTAVVKDIEHTPKYWSDNLVRAAVGDFVSVQTKEWTSKYKCKEDSPNSGLFNCDKPEVDTCFPGWTKNDLETCECCSKPDTSDTSAALDHPHNHMIFLALTLTKIFHFLADAF